MNILIVDDVESNIGVLRLLIEEWFEEHNINLDDLNCIETAHDGQQGFDKIKQKYYDVVFLDIMMPVLDGFEALTLIRSEPLEKQPVIVMQTALGDSQTKQKAKRLGADAYITKPIKYNMIEAMLDRYIQLPSNEDEFDDFDDFCDFDEFDDFDDFVSEEIDEQKEMMDNFNASHKKVPSCEFIKDYPDLSYILEDLEDLDNDINYMIDYLDEMNLGENTDELEHILKNYSRFLNTFIDFYELSTSLNLLVRVLINTNFNNLDEKSNKFIASFIIAILKDLQEWKDHVFIAQDAIDVFYINASALNSCIQLESYIKNNSKI